MASFTYVGSQQSYVVPLGVTLLKVECWGAQGQTARGTADGGRGGYVVASLPVTPGETLYVNVGGQGGGFNGAGLNASYPTTFDGGGMSDVRQGGTGTGNIVVVGGGGGGAGNASGAYGGAGGNPGHRGVGYLTYYGGGGTQSSGGAAGGGGATPGAAFVGGNASTGYSGAGGSGYYGGGGAYNLGFGVAGGGGGASWAGPTAFNVSYTDGTQGSNGQVKITIPGPPVPSLVTPVSGASQDSATAVTLAWIYNQSAAGTTQTKFAIRRKTTGSYVYLTAPSNWASSTRVDNTGSAMSQATGTWAANTYNWSVATTDSNGAGSFANDFTLTTVGAPTVSVTAPTGTATTDPVAHGAWTPTTPGGAQTTYRAIVYTAAQYGIGGFTVGTSPSTWDSGIVGNTNTTQDSAVLSNATYRYYVQIGQTGGQISPWAFSAFTINCTVPPTPTLSAALDPANGRTILTVTAGASAQPVSVQYNDDGATWLVLRNATYIATGGGNIATIYDYEAPPQGTRQYRAMASTALLVPSLWSTTATVVNTNDGFWLKDVTGSIPNVKLSVLLGSDSTSQPETLTAHQGLGRADDIIRADVIKLPNGQLSIYTRSDVEDAAVMALLLAQRTLLFQNPNGFQSYVRIDSARPDSMPYPSGHYHDRAVTWRGQPKP